MVGLPTLRDLGLVGLDGVDAVTLRLESQTESSDWIKQYAKVFTGLSKIMKSVKLEFQENAVPKAFLSRHVPLADRHELNRELD